MYTHAFDRLVEAHRCKFVWVQYRDDGGRLQGRVARLVAREHPYGRFTLLDGTPLLVPLERITTILNQEVPA